MSFKEKPIQKIGEGGSSIFGHLQPSKLGIKKSSTILDKKSDKL